MEILNSLGVNSTIFVQFGIFLFTFLVLNLVAFKPYAKAHRERHGRTLGEEELAKKLFTEGQDLEFHYEKRAREINDEIRSIFDSARGEANKRYSEILESARLESQKVVVQTREKIRAETEVARAGLVKEVPSLAGAITERLIGKELGV